MKIIIRVLLGIYAVFCIVFFYKSYVLSCGASAKHETLTTKVRAAGMLDKSVGRHEVYSTEKPEYKIPDQKNPLKGDEYIGSATVVGNAMRSNPDLLDKYFLTFNQMTPVAYFGYLNARNASGSEILVFSKIMTEWRSNIADLNASDLDTFDIGIRKQKEREYLAQRNQAIDQLFGSGAAKDLSQFREASNQRDIAMDVARFAEMQGESFNASRVSAVVEALSVNAIQIKLIDGKVIAPSEENYVRTVEKLKGCLPASQLEYLVILLSERKLKEVPLEKP